MSGSPQMPSEPAASAATGVDDLATFFVLTNRIAARLQETVGGAGSGTTLADWLLLRVVDTAGTPTLAEAGRKIGIGVARLSDQAAILAAAGLITISRREDGKTRQLSLSPRGAEILAAIGKRLEETLAAEGGTLATRIGGARRGAVRLAKGLAAARPAGTRIGVGSPAA